MKQRAFLGIVFVGSIFAAAACGGSGNTGIGGSGATGGSGGDATTSTTTTTTSSSSSTTSSSSSTTTSSSSSTTSSSTSSGGGTPADHLVISEIGVAPAGGEFIEIYNAGSTAVDLSKYYVSDNSGYHGIAAGTAWNPVTSNPGTDFLAQFPAGTMLGAGATLVIASDVMNFEMNYKKCPDFVLAAADFTCTSGTAKAMLAPTNGGIGDKVGTLLSNDREMVILFTWDGVATTVKDVDYVVWGATFDDATRVEKTGMAGYQADTPRANQKAATAPTTAFTSIERCTLETGEKLSGGNGLTGHDETSEPLDTNFVPQAMPTPGVKNACLP